MKEFLAEGEVIRWKALRISFEILTFDNIYYAQDLRVSGKGNSVTAHSDKFLCRDGSLCDDCFFEAEITPRRDGFELICRARHREEIRGIRFLLDGLPPARIILNRSWDMLNKNPIPISPRPSMCVYPSPVKFSFYIFQVTDSDFLVVRTCQNPPRPKVLRTRITAEGTSRLSFYDEQYGTKISNRMETCRWVIERLPDPAPAVEDQIKWMSREYRLQPFQARTDIPQWAKQISLRINHHGMDYYGKIHRNYAQMLDDLRVIAKHFPPQNVLVYPVGWEGEFARRRPYFEPCERLGGKEGFRRLIKEGQALGYRFQPYLNIFSTNQKHGGSDPFLKCRLKDFTGKYLAYGYDEDNDGNAEYEYWYMNPGKEPFRSHLLSTIDNLVREYGIEAVHLDQTPIFVNERTTDFYADLMSFLTELRQRQPYLLIGGEGNIDHLYEFTVFCENHYHFTDPWLRKIAVHFGRIVGYLNTADAGFCAGVQHPIFYWPFEVADKPVEGVIPTLAICRDTMEKYFGGVLKTLELARRYKDRYCRNSKDKS